MLNAEQYLNELKQDKYRFYNFIKHFKKRFVHLITAALNSR